MRKILKIILMLQVMSATAQIGVHTDFPDNSSAMDIVASNRGLLIPRVTLTSSLSNPSPVTSPAVGLLVFNSGSNQPIGFYYWNGSAWVLVGGGSSGGGNDWTLTGNAGTIPGTNFLGTTDNQHFLVYTNNAERIRFESDGQVIIGGTAPNNSTDRFTVFGNSTQNAAINAYSPRTGFQTVGGRYGILSTVDTANGFACYGRNLDPLGYGMVSVGSNYTSVGLIASHTAGVHSQGYDGLHAWGKDANGYGIFSMGSAATGPYNLAGISAGISAVGSYGIITRGTSSSGRGIVALGSGQSTPSTSLESEGGAFTGFHGIYSKGNGYQTTPQLIAGIGVIGVGYNYASYSALASGLSSGGAFSGDYGVYAKGLNAAGTGVVGVGTNGGGYYTVTNGSGGAFTGYHGSLSVGTNTTGGIGVIGAGNDGVYTMLPSFGAGGSFTGDNIGVAGFGTSSTAGIGVIGAGNGSGALYPSAGAGGSFTGIVGLYGKSTASNGTGIIGIGNNIASPSTVSTGSGGSFSGTVCGVYGYAANSSSDRYGGYFATGGSLYAYVGGRYSNTNRKIVGSGTVSTIVKNRQGERITLTCPEAPEVVFQDFGVGQIIDGVAHITIDPDLAINIVVSEKYPLKVYITPEGDCNGVYVTNKSAEGFDVIELQGGKSNIPFSWQIVATRANEEYQLSDGTVEISDYSQRFQPAPPPLEFLEQPLETKQEIRFETMELNTVRIGKESYSTDHNSNSQTLEEKREEVIEYNDNPDE